MKSLLVFAAVILFAPLAMASTLSFTGKQSVWQCPPDAQYILMQCKAVAEKEMPITVTMDGDGQFAQGEWISNREVPAYFNVLASHYTNVYVGNVISLIVSAGFNEDYHLNSPLFFEFEPEHPMKSFLMEGTRKRVGEFDFVPTFEFSDMKFTL